MSIIVLAIGSIIIVTGLAVLVKPARLKDLLYILLEKDWFRIVAALILELGACTLGELGKWTGRDITTLSSAAKRLQMRAKRNLKLAEKMRKILESVS